MTTIKKDARFGDEHLCQPKVIDDGAFLCQSVAEPGERKHDLDLRSAPQENPRCSEPFLPCLPLPLDPQIVQNFRGLTEARTSPNSQDLDPAARLTP